MTVAVSNRFDGVLGAGASTGGSGLVPFATVRSPSTGDITGPNGPWRIGQSWINSTANASFVLTSLTSSAGQVLATWTEATNRSTFLETLTGNSGVATAVAGNINAVGTTNQITTTGSGSTLTLSVPSTFIAPGSIAATTSATVGTTLGVSGTTTLAALNQVGTANINTSGAAVTSIGTGATGAVNIGNTTGNTAVTGSLTASTSLTATLGNLTATNGNLVLGTAGNKVNITTGANASAGTATLSGGTVTVATSAVTPSSLIFVTRNTPSGNQGQLSVPSASIVAASSFDIQSSEGGEGATVNWWLIN